MSWIKEIDESEAEGLLKEVYSEVKGERGKVSNVMKAQSLDPGAMQAHLGLYLSVMFAGHGDITPEQREIIATVVSAVNGCEYCANHHAQALNHYWKDEKAVGELMESYETYTLPTVDREIVNYAVKLTRSPNEVGKTDIEALREVGLSDEDILRVNMITAYFNFVNRIVLGLGVEFTQEEMAGYRH